MALIVRTRLITQTDHRFVAFYFYTPGQIIGVIESLRYVGTVPLKAVQGESGEVVEADVVKGVTYMFKQHVKGRCHKKRVGGFPLASLAYQHQRAHNQRAVRADQPKKSN